MIDKLFKKIGQGKDNKDAKPQAAPQPDASEKEDALDETGTFMLDISKLKEAEDLEDLLNDV